MKVDISDGFYRIAINLEEIPKLTASLPTRPGEEPLVVFLLVLPMGWANSPLIFCSATKTIIDLENHKL